MTGRSQMLSTGDIRDWDALVDEVLRCLVLKAPVDCRHQLELQAQGHRANAVLRAEDGIDHGRTCVYQRRAELQHSALVGSCQLCSEVIRQAQRCSSPPATCLSHLCPLLKPFDEFRCHLAGTLGSPITHCVRWCPRSPRKGEICRSNPAAKICSCKLLLPAGEYKRAIPFFLGLQID